MDSLGIIMVLEFQFGVALFIQFAIPYCWEVASGDIIAVQNHWQDIYKVADWLQVG